MDGPAHISITLPLPPSANKSWRPGIAPGGHAAMFKRAPYKAWLADAKERVAEQAAGDRVPYRYHLRIVLPETPRDPDNSIKLLQDALQRGGVIADDKHLRRLVLEVDAARLDQTALCELWALTDPNPATSCFSTSSEVAKQEVPRPRTVSARVGGSTFALPADKLPPGWTP